MKREPREIMSTIKVFCVILKTLGKKKPPKQPKGRANGLLKPTELISSITVHYLPVPSSLGRNGKKKTLRNLPRRGGCVKRRGRKRHYPKCISLT